MKTTFEQLHIAPPKEDPFSLFTREGLAGDIHRVAIDVLEQVEPSSNMDFALRKAIDGFKKICPSGDEMYLWHVEELLEELWEISEQYANELPDIDSPQYSEGEKAIQQLEYAFEVLFDSDKITDLSSDALRLQGTLISLAFELAECLEQDQQDLEDLIKMFPPR